MSGAPVTAGGIPTDIAGHAADSRWWHQRWATILIAFASAFGTGVLLGHILGDSGIWGNGFPWEREFLTRVHGPLGPVADIVIINVQWLGTNVTLIPMVAIAGTWLWRRGHRQIAMRLFVVQAGSYLLVPSLKSLFDRARPDLFARRGFYSWSAYPSGHSITSMAVLLTIALMLHRHRGWWWSYFVVVPVSVLSMYSRLYMGVHWPTDVLAGMLVGFVWLVGTIVAFRP